MFYIEMVMLEIYLSTKEKNREVVKFNKSKIIQKQFNILYYSIWFGYPLGHRVALTIFVASIAFDL